MNHNNKIDCYRIWLIAAIPNIVFMATPIALKWSGVVDWPWRWTLMPLALSVAAAVFLVGLMIREDRRP